MVKQDITINANNQDARLPRMRVGTDDFKTLLLKSDVFVDKSLMVQDITRGRWQGNPNCLFETIW